MKPRAIDHKSDYEVGSALLRSIGWVPDAEAMAKLPSIANGTKLRTLIINRAVKTGKSEEDVAKCVHLAACIEHLIAIGGESMRPHFLNGRCILTSEQIARLCRRMPPFIAVKLKDLATGKVNIDSNPTGAFDTNGWPELRTRLPKFRSSLQHYAQQSMDSKTRDALGPAKIDEIRALLQQIQGECDQLLNAIAKFTPVGPGTPRVTKKAVERTLPWSQMTVKFSQVLGVLQKTNRDLRSTHWRPEWIPTKADFEIVSADVEAMRDAAEQLAARITR